MSNQFEFAVSGNALETIRTLTLDANFEEMEVALTEITAPYKNLVVTADAVSNAKTDRARIRKVEKNIDDYRKMVKKTYEAPLKEFEEKCKRLTGICKEASDNLDYQVKVFEETAKATKLECIKQTYDSCDNEETKYYTPWKRLVDTNPRWTNVTYSLDDAIADVQKALSNTERDLSVIRSLHSEFEIEVLLRYEQTGDLHEALEQNERLMKRKIEQERPRVSKPQTSVEPDEFFAEVYTVDFRIKATKQQLNMLREFLIENGIKYGKVE